MILEALCEYYKRKADDPSSDIAPEGFEWKEIPFIVVIDKEGRFVALEDTREGEGKKKQGRRLLVPQGEKKTSGIKANLLWDNIEYALGAQRGPREASETKKLAFIERIKRDLPPPDEDERTKALLTFLAGDPVEAIAKQAHAAMWAECLETGPNVTFRIDGDGHTSVCSSFRDALRSKATIKDGENATCLVSGRKAHIERIHPSIKGVWNAQTAGAALVSFNAKAFCSYGKDQNFNAPISTAAVFAYSTALNTLLSKGSHNKIQVGDATAVFWSAQKHDFEDHFSAFFSMAPKDSPDRDILAVRALYDSIHTGTAAVGSDTRFFVLGLAPNAARLSVRFWQTGTVAQFSSRLARHFDDLEIVRGAKDIGHYALFWLLSGIAAEGKIDNIPPNLSGDLVRAILEDRPYPATLLQQAIRRIRAERQVTRIRAAVLKASLNRFQRVHPTTHKEITVALDLSNNDSGYRLGRLFAALEKIQEDAQPGINATIRDRFYGAASSNPVSVFPQLLKLKNHHLSKIENGGFRRRHEDRLTEIIGGLAAQMPSHLSMDEQARFAIGYYHQRQAFYAKSTPIESTPSA